MGVKKRRCSARDIERRMRESQALLCLCTVEVVTGFVATGQLPARSVIPRSFPLRRCCSGAGGRQGELLPRGPEACRHAACHRIEGRSAGFRFASPHLIHVQQDCDRADEQSLSWRLIAKDLQGVGHAK